MHQDSITEDYKLTQFPIQKDIWEEDRETFLKIREKLLSKKKYKNKYIAILNGKIVDVDDDEKKLVRRVYDKFGYIPIYVGKISNKKETYKLRSPKLK